MKPLYTNHRVVTLARRMSFSDTGPEEFRQGASRRSDTGHIRPYALCQLLLELQLSLQLTQVLFSGGTNDKRLQAYEQLILSKSD